MVFVGVSAGGAILAAVFQGARLEFWQGALLFMFLSQTLGVKIRVWRVERLLSGESRKLSATDNESDAASSR